MSTAPNQTILGWLLGGWGKYVLGVGLILVAVGSSEWRTPAMLLLVGLLLYQLESKKP